MSDLSIRKLIKHIQTVIDKKIDERLANVMFVKPATVETISDDGSNASVKMLADNSIIENVENYNTRSIAPGEPCHIVHWGAANRLNNKAILFGGQGEKDAQCPYWIGDIYYTTRVDVDPHARWQGTVWARWAEGRAVVGVGTGQFAGAETEVGALEHNHPMINHLHSQTNHIHVQTVHAHGMGAHTHALNSSGHAQIAAFSDSIALNSGAVTGWNQTGRVPSSAPIWSVAPRGHATFLGGNTGAMSAANTANSAAANTGNVVTAVNTGNPTALGNLANRSNVQPSITCYMWKRIA